MGLDRDLSRFSDELNAAQCRDDIRTLLWDHRDLIERLSENSQELLLCVVQDRVALLTD
jgi:hypothetical protein